MGAVPKARVPEGVNFRVIEQDWPGATGPEQVFVCEKFCPAIEMLFTWRSALPQFWIVSNTGLEVSVSRVSGNFSLVEDRHVEAAAIVVSILEAKVCSEKLRNMPSIKGFGILGSKALVVVGKSAS
jgi:hypothetical protein